MSTLLQDLRYGFRILAKNRASTVIAVVTLALGIGAATTMFSIIECAVLDAFPFADAHRLVMMIAHDTRYSGDGNFGFLSASELLDYQNQNHVFDIVFGQGFQPLLMTGSGEPLNFRGSLVTSDFFRGLGVPTLLGRSLGAEDNKPGAPPVAVLVYETWQSKFNRDPGIVGRTLILNHQPTTVVGVTPPRFNPFIPDFYLPAPLSTAKPVEQQTHFILYGHLKPGVSLKQAIADVAVLDSRFAKFYPKDHPKERTNSVEFLTKAGMAEQQRTHFFLMGAVCLLLLIACVNVANLLLARATTREKEIAIRASLGATRGRLFRQFLVESLLIALGGAILGCLIAWGALAGILAMIPAGGGGFWPSEAVIRINGVVLLFTAGLAIFSTVLCGLVPAMRAAGKSVQDPLKESGQRVGESRAHYRLRNLLVANEVVLALVLLTGAGLLMRAFFTMSRVQLGFNPDNVLAAWITLPQEQYKTPEQRNQFHREVLRHLRAVPGVSSAALGFIPVFGGADTAIEISGKPAAETSRARAGFASDRYFETMGIPLIQGRTISEGDFASARKVAVVNRTFVAKYLGGEDPLGKVVKLKMLERGPAAVPDPRFEIIGVTGDVRNNGLDMPPEPWICIPYTVLGIGWDNLLVRTSGEPGRLVNTLRREVASIDEGLPLNDARPVREILKNYLLARPRFMTSIMAAFAAVGLVLVSIGVYSVLSYSVSQRTQEIGVRMALGAQAADVRRMLLLASLRWVLLGLVIGVPVSIGLVKVFQGRIWALKSSDPLTLAAVATMLLVVGIVASYLPARRPTKVDPMDALRYE